MLGKINFLTSEALENIHYNMIITKTTDGLIIFVYLKESNVIDLAYHIKATRIDKKIGMRVGMAPDGVRGAIPPRQGTWISFGETSSLSGIKICCM